jgi:uncharacterized protein
MKKITLFLCLIIISVTTKAQDKETEQILKIAGHAQLFVTPDMGVLHVNIRAIDMTAAKAITKLNEKTKDVIRQLNSIGFKETEIKTTSFQINENRIYRDREHKDSGYVAMQSVEVEFQNNRDLITKILNTFSGSQTDFKLNFSFKLSDKKREEVKNELIKLSIDDARKKSELIAKSAGIKLGKIVEINSGVVSNNDPYVSRGLASIAAKMEGDILGFTPKDLMFTEKVIMMWKFE